MISISDIYGNVWIELAQDVARVSQITGDPDSLLMRWSEPEFLSGLNTYDSVILVLYAFDTPDFNVNDLTTATSVSSTIFKRTPENQAVVNGLDLSLHYFVTVHFVIPRNNVGIGDAYTGDIPTSPAPPENPVVGQVYYNPVNNTTSMWSGTAWIPASTSNTITGTELPTSAELGQFFYNTRSNELLVWNGTSWSLANTENRGLATADKIGIGSDGSYDERAALINVVKRLLGWPSQCIELSDEDFNVCITNAIQEFRRRCDNAYNQEYYFLKLIPGQEIYYLNDPETGTNRVVEVIKIHRLNNFGLNATIGTDGNILAQAYLNMFVTNGTLDTVTLYATAAMTKHLSLMFAGEMAFTWKEPQRQLRIFKKITRPEIVLLQTAAEKTEQELIADRFANQWIQDWTRGEAYEMLGNIRGKYASLPGPNGGIQLNGSECFARSDAIFTECLRQIQDMEVGNGVSWGNSMMLLA